MIAILIMLDIFSIIFVILEIFQIVEYAKIDITYRNSGIDRGRIKKNIGISIMLIVISIAVAVILNISYI